MPGRSDINQLITSSDRQDVIRKKYLGELSDYTKRNTIVYATAFTSKKVQLHRMPNMLLSVTSEDIQGFMSAMHELKGENLDLIIHSPGGSAETTEQIVNYLRSKFNHIRAIIPQNAMSAATMLACGCDEIVMARHSALGPIDPQMGVMSGNGGQYFLPAQSILDEFEQAKAEVIANPKLATLWVNRINSYPHGFFKKCEDTIQLAKTMVESWLNDYMFGNVQPNDAKKIADWLGNAGEHLTHGKPINIDLARNHGLNVTLLEDDADLQDLVLSIFHSTMVTFDVTGCVKLIENQNGKGWYSSVNVK
ncbi:MAG: hypothetical protein R2730_00260 [Chitinophagales bacterium]